MIISYVSTTMDPQTREKTYWFTVKLRGHECTSLDVGFDKNGKWVSASGSVLSLDPKVQKEIVEATIPMVEKVI